MAIDQGLVVLAEVDTHAAQHGIVAPFTDQALGKQCGHPPAAKRKTVLASQRHEVSSERVLVPNRERKIIGDEIRGRHRIEKSIRDRKQSTGAGRCWNRLVNAHRFNAGEAVEIPSSQVILTFCCDLAHGRADAANVPQVGSFQRS